MDEGNALPSDPASMRKSVLCAFLLIVAFIPMSPAVGDAQVTTTITSSGLNTQVNQVGNSHNITGGSRPGGGPNLFHSFGQFDVGQTAGVNDIANFLNNTGLPTSNILGRVAGGNISNIDGTIQTTGFGNANLFLMNPSGIVLGPGASLNVGGSISFTTAQYLRLFDGVGSTIFYANPANDGLANSILTINPSAFEFLSASPAAYGFLTAPDPNAMITVQGSMLKVPEGQSLSLVGGNITVQSGILGDGMTQAANLQAPGGRINLVSVASPGEVLVSNFQPAPNINGASFTTMGTVTLKEGATLNVSGQLDEFGTPIGQGNSGTILIRGGQLVMEASTIQAITWGTVDGERAAVDIQVSETVALTNSSSAITTATFGSGRGGDVRLTAPTLTLENSLQSIFTTTGEGGGVGGDVVLNVGTVRLLGGSSIESSSQIHNFTPGLGQGGNVTIQGLEGAGSAAESVTLSGNSSLSSTTSGSGDGGRLAITSKSLTMDGAATSVNTSTTEAGRGGDIVVSVRHANLSGGARLFAQTNNSDINAQPGPTLTVQGLEGAGSLADSVVLLGSGSGIVSDTQGFASSGDVAVHAKTVSLTDGAVIQAGTLDTTAAGGNVTIAADLVTISGGSGISSQARGADAGQIHIRANRLILNNVSISSNTVSNGRGGNVVLNVGAVSLLNEASINSSTSESGRAGDITMDVGTLSLAHDSRISSASTGASAITNPDDGTTQAPGTAGNVVITATGSFTSDASTIATSAEANHGGDVSITAHSVHLSNGTVITANSKGPLTVTQLVLDANGQLVEQVVGNGNAGNIRIESGSTFLMEQSSVTTQASQASGGQITINAPHMVRLTDSPINTSVRGAVGDSNGGSISIDPDFVVLKGSPILAKAFAGSGGAIDVTAGLFLADPASVVDASSTLGVSGTVQINAPINNLSSVVARLPESLLAVQALLRASCAAKLAQGATSSFVERGRDGIPAGPDGLLASPYLPMTSEHSNQRQAKPVAKTSEIQLRRLFRPEMPASVTLISDHGGCSS
jgi:filamentous hemagglutinin family protein